MSLKGSIESINLADIMQLVANSKQSGRFILTKSDDEKGYIYVVKGEIIHAEAEPFSGEDALFTMISWEKGDFLFEESEFEVENSITRSVTSLLMEKIGSVDSVPVFNEIDRGERRKISLSTLEWIVISKIDGVKSIAEISQHTGINIYDTSRIIFGMLASGLLSLK